MAVAYRTRKVKGVKELRATSSTLKEKTPTGVLLQPTDKQGPNQNSAF